MKGINILLILFLSNLYLMNYLYKNINNNIIQLDFITFVWLEFIIVGNIIKLSYNKIKDKIYYYTMFLVNKNQSVLTNDYTGILLLPSHFTILLLCEYCANTDREYLFTINNNINIIINTILLSLYIFINTLYSFINTLYIFINSYYIYINLLKLIAFYNLYCNIIYIKKYIKQIHSTSSVNMNSIDFPTGYLLRGRPSIYINIFFIAVPLYNIFI